METEKGGLLRVVTWEEKSGEVAEIPNSIFKVLPEVQVIEAQRSVRLSRPGRGVSHRSLTHLSLLQSLLKGLISCQNCVISLPGRHVPLLSDTRAPASLLPQNRIFREILILGSGLF